MTIFYFLYTGLPTKDETSEMTVRLIPYNRDDCTEFVLSVFIYLGFSATINLYLSLPTHLISHCKSLFKTKD